MENHTVIQVKIPTANDFLVKEQSIQCKIDEDSKFFFDKSRKRNFTPKPMIEKLAPALDIHTSMRKYISPVHLAPPLLKTRTSLNLKKDKATRNSLIKQSGTMKIKLKEKTIMEYYHDLLERPNKPTRTPYNFHKKAACTNGYRTKMQKDPQIIKTEFGSYHYRDTYTADAKKQSRIITSFL